MYFYPTPYRMISFHSYNSLNFLLQFFLSQYSVLNTIKFFVTLQLGPRWIVQPFAAGISFHKFVYRTFTCTSTLKYWEPKNFISPQNKCIEFTFSLDIIW